MSSVPPSSILHLNVQLTEAIVDPLTLNQRYVYRDVSRSGAILDSPIDYYVGVERLSVPLSSLPLYIAPMDPLATNGVDTLDYISIQHNGTVVSAPVRLLKPANQIFIDPTQRPENYSWVYDRQTLAAMKNETIQRILDGSWIPGSIWLSYNSVTQLEVITCYPLSLWDQSDFNTVQTPANLYINRSSVNSWRGWSSTENTLNTTTANKLYYLINLRNDGTNFVPPNAAPGNFVPTPSSNVTLIATQVFPNTSLIACSTIEVHSTLPAMPEQTDSGVNLFSATNESSPISRNENTAILTDLIPDFTLNPNSYQDMSIYNGGGLGQIRWIKLTGRTPITQFSISIFWVDRDGIRHRLPVFDERCAVKLIFAHRNIIEQSTIVGGRTCF
jgi:hypothetical protein